VREYPRGTRGGGSLVGMGAVAFVAWCEAHFAA